MSVGHMGQVGQGNSHGEREAPHPPKMRRGGLLAAWYRLTTPALPEGADRGARDRVRRARLASILLLLALIVWLIAAPIQYMQGLLFVPVFAAGLFFGLGGLVLNRLGYVTAVGWLFVVAINASFLAILHSPEQLLLFAYASALTVLIYSDLIAVAVLPPVAVLVVASVNIVLIVGAYFDPTTTLRAGLRGSPVVVEALLLQPITLQVVVALVTFLHVRSVSAAIARADRAETAAMAAGGEEAARRSELEEGVRQLLAAQVQLANGDFTVRVPPVRDALLWKVGISFNTLVRRLERLANAERALHQAQLQLRLTQDELLRVREELERIAPPERWPRQTVEADYPPPRE